MDTDFRKKNPTIRWLSQTKEEGILNEDGSFWSNTSKSSEELCDWIFKIRDLGDVYEKELLSQKGNGTSQQPIVFVPILYQDGNTPYILGFALRASIAYGKKRIQQWEEYIGNTVRFESVYRPKAMGPGEELSSTIGFAI